jgi:hypothetical protein
VAVRKTAPTFDNRALARIQRRGQHLPMPEFPKQPFVPRTPGLGGAELRADPAAILKACEDAGPLFVLFRNEACIFGSVADPLWYLQTANVHLASSGSITLNLAPDRRCTAFAYIEAGPQGGFIDAVEFCGPRDQGFLKICRMERTDRACWLSLLSEFHAGAAPASRIAGLRKTNHLEVPAGARGLPSPAELMIERFLECAVRCGATLYVTAQAHAARGRLVIRPTHRVRTGHWSVLSSNETAFHVAPGSVTELRILTRPHLAQLVLFGAGGRFAARILTRDRELLSQFAQIL